MKDIEGISIIRKILRSTVVVIIIIETIILILLNLTTNTLPFEKGEGTIILINRIVMVELVFLILAIIIFVVEHKRNNRGEFILDEETIPEKFDTDNIKKEDIIYLSTILNQRYPGKKEVILLLMQLINKNVIDLSVNFDGKKHQYMIEKRKNFSYELNEAERKLIDLVFKQYTKTDLMDAIEIIYKSKDTKNVIRECLNYVKKKIFIEETDIKSVYKIIGTIMGVGLAFLLAMIFIFSINILAEKMELYVEIHEIFLNVIIYSFIIIAMLLLVNFIIITLLKKITLKYQYDNDSFLWISKVIILFGLLLISSYIYPNYLLLRFVMQLLYFILYSLGLLIIMTKYNIHICLDGRQMDLKVELISIKNYLKNMDYLRDKEFGNIITYEEYMMYGFLFNITIKVNSEFDIIQKEIREKVIKESKSYVNLLRELMEEF